MDNPSRRAAFPRVGVTIDMHPLDEVGGVIVHDRPEARFEGLGGAHAWFCDLDELDSGPNALSLLSAAERVRAERLRGNLDRRRFVARRAFVRRVLGSMVNRPAESLAFRPGRCGKPYLSNGTEPGGEVLRTLNFSVSRSEDVLGVTVAFGREVGMDLEVVRSIPDPLAIAATQFGPAGLDLLESSPARERDFQFYRLWTRKEACAKLQGRGIDCRHAHETPAIERWTLCSFTFREHGKGVVGALALENHAAATPASSAH